MKNEEEKEICKTIKKSTTRKWNNKSVKKGLNGAREFGKKGLNAGKSVKGMKLREKA